MVGSAASRRLLAPPYDHHSLSAVWCSRGVQVRRKDPDPFGEPHRSLFFSFFLWFCDAGGGRDFPRSWVCEDAAATDLLGRDCADQLGHPESLS